MVCGSERNTNKVKLISNLARHGGVFVDVGANYGYYSLIWASLNLFSTASMLLNLYHKTLKCLILTHLKTIVVTGT